MSKKQRNLDGVYFRVQRDGKWLNICYSDMTEDERNTVIYDRMSDKPMDEQVGYYKRLAEIVADALYDMGEQLGVMCE